MKNVGNITKLALAVALVVLLSMLCPQPAYAATTEFLDQSYTSGDDGQWGFEATYWRGQTFTPSISAPVVKISFKAYTSTQSGTAYFRIYNTLDGLPTGSPLCSASMDASTITTSSPGAWYDVTFSGCPTLTAGTMYALVGYKSDANWVYWRDDGSSPTYADGHFVQSADSGSTWSSDTNKDYMFKIYLERTWESYSDSGHTTVCNDFENQNNTVYMFGEGFTPSTGYRIIYWDGGGNNRETDDNSSDANGNLSSQHTFAADDQAGTWYATVYDDQSYSPVSHDPTDSHIIVDDSFTVQQNAIPEFPEVVTAIAVCMLCAVAYLVMRRKVVR